MRLILVFLPLFLGGCLASVEGADRPTDKEWAHLHRALDLWDDKMPPIGAECQANFFKFRLVDFVDVESVSTACGRFGKVVGCYIPDTHGIFGSKENPTIIYKSGDTEWLIIQHEFAHWASSCVWGNADGAHANAAVWGYYVELGRNEDGQ